METLCLSARFVVPFAKTLSRYEAYDRASLERIEAIDPGTRIPVALACTLAVDQVEKTGDHDLGLKAAREMPLGCAGPLDYALRSAATLKQAIETAGRYSRLFNDALSIELVAKGGRAVVMFHSSEPLPRAICDFSMSAWCANHFQPVLADGPRVEAFFAHPQPDDTGEYDRAFAGMDLRFGAPFYGLAFDRAWLDAPLPAGDPRLHDLLCDDLSRSIGSLSAARTLTHRVRELLATDRALVGPSASAVARNMRMSQRTLARRLEREGTTFSAIVDGVRRELALRYTASHHLSFAEIAARLGFAHVEAFHRAFRRWTGQSPGAYRQAVSPAAS
jgi:AraC-like DNA-binding protein